MEVECLAVSLEQYGQYGVVTMPGWVWPNLIRLPALSQGPLLGESFAEDQAPAVPLAYLSTCHVAVTCHKKCLEDEMNTLILLFFVRAFTRKLYTLNTSYHKYMSQCKHFGASKAVVAYARQSLFSRSWAGFGTLRTSFVSAT